MIDNNTIKTNYHDFLFIVTSGALSFKSNHLDEIKLIREARIQVRSAPLAKLGCFA